MMHKFHGKWIYREKVKPSVEHQIYCQPIGLILDTWMSFLLTFDWFIDNGIDWTKLAHAPDCRTIPLISKVTYGHHISNT